MRTKLSDTTVFATALLGATLVGPTLLGLAHAAGAAGIEEAGIVHGALLAGPAGGTLATLAAGGAPRGLPAISPDGTAIAFVQSTDRRQALSDIVVVGLDGHELSRTPIEPVEPGVGYSGMQHVEALRWISPDRIVIRGSINPAQSQYYVLDAHSGKIVDDFTDDQSATAFSPDGLHVVSLSGSPHYTPAADQLPVLSRDDTPIWHGAAGAALAATPRFSADGTSIAWATRDASGAHAMLAIWHGGALHQTVLPAGPDATLDLHWAGTRVVATAAPSEAGGRILAWSADADGAALTPQAAAADPDQAAHASRDKLVRQAHQAGINEPDFWCATCSLAALPRGGE